MVIRGNSRGNPKQLSTYLLELKDNEAVRILDVDGRLDPQPEHLHSAVQVMGLSAELSKGGKGLYHAQINPAPGEDKLMDDEKWQQAADILGKELGLENQRRVIVLHTKKGRTHAHVVWERFDIEQGKMVSDSFSRLAQDRARKEMERVLEHKPTPHRNKHRPELKAAMAQLWEQTKDGKDFVRQAKEQGYLIAAGSGKDPFIVVDENARSYNLNRQIKGVRLKELRARLRDEPLVGEKEAIVLARAAKDAAVQEREGRSKQRAAYSQQSTYTMNFSYSYTAPGSDKQGAAKDAAGQNDGKATKEKMADNSRDVTDKEQTAQQRARATAKDFAAGRDDMMPGGDAPDPAQQRAKDTAKAFAQNRGNILPDRDLPNDAKPTLAQQHKDNRGDVTGQQPDKTKQQEFRENMALDEQVDRRTKKEKIRDELRQRMAERDRQRDRDREQGLERD